MIDDNVTALGATAQAHVKRAEEDRRRIDFLETGRANALSEANGLTSLYVREQRRADLFAMSTQRYRRVLLKRTLALHDAQKARDILRTSLNEIKERYELDSSDKNFRLNKFEEENALLNESLQSQKGDQEKLLEQHARCVESIEAMNKKISNLKIWRYALLALLALAAAEILGYFPVN